MKVRNAKSSPRRSSQPPPKEAALGKAINACLAALTTFSLVSICLLAWPPAASAMAGQACMNTSGPDGDDYGRLDAAESNDLSEKGFRSNVRIIDKSLVECQYISSIQMNNASYNGSFEVGYMVGWSDPSNHSAPCAGLDDKLFSRPVMFNWRIHLNGTSACTAWPNSQPTPSTDHEFKVADTDANQYWNSYYDGSALQPNGIYMGWSQGWGEVNMERGTANDTGYGRWLQDEEYHANNGWTYTENVHQTTHEDPDYAYAGSTGHDGHTWR